MIQTLIWVLVATLLWLLAWTRRSSNTRYALLLLGSYVFYASWGIGFLAVLVASSLLNYACGLALRRKPTLGRLWVGVGLNVLLLGVFKYLPPAIASSSGFLGHIIMPVGMSFWTFQGLSYLFDLYREEELDPALLEFCLYMAFWPTVLAGPVCRLPNLLPQFRRTPVWDRDDISIGFSRIVQGVFMKMVLAQLLGAGLTRGAGVTAGFDQTRGGWGPLDVSLLAVGFGFQLFFDFAGYSHMVTGVARVFGIRLEENFDRPYFSPTPSVFWTRWHMSLSFWIRDYVFLPLAAMRRDVWWPYAVFVMSMTLFGLWHAAKLTFILWGVYHGLLLVAHRAGQKLKRRISNPWPAPVGGLLSWCATFFLVSLGWIFFRANDAGQAAAMLRAVVTPSGYWHSVLPWESYVVVCFVVIVYFAYHGLLAGLDAARARYSETMAREAGVFGTASATTTFGAATIVTVRVVDFFGERLWWWAAPTIAVLIVSVGAAIVRHNTAISVTPFMYTVF